MNSHKFAYHKKNKWEIKRFIQLIRPKEWVKSILVFVPIFFGGKLFDLHIVIIGLKGGVLFCLLASIMYIINDIKDSDIDILHIKKRYRPIASGDISKSQAFLLLSILIATFLFFLYYFMAWNGWIWLLVYFFMNIAYSFGLKKQPIIDIMIVACGFSLRVIYGSDITDTEYSPWAVFMVYFLALILVIGKRKEELEQYNGKNTRPVLKKYTLPFLDIILALTGCVTIVCYIIYSLEERTEDLYQSDYVHLSVFFVIGGVFRYLQLAFSDTDTQFPTDILYKDRIIQFFIILWILFLFFLKYLGNNIPV